MESEVSNFVSSKTKEINKKSKEAIVGLEPKEFFQNFYDISRIPRGSSNEEGIISFIEEFCSSRKLKSKRDKVGNLVVFIPESSKEFEHSPIVVLQAHVDMVCVKSENKIHDFKKDPIELVKKDDFIEANETTLGADDGAGIAAILSLIHEIGSFSHGKINVIFTIQEEIGLVGARNIEKGECKGDYLLNLDGSRGENIVIGCAGSKNTILKYKFKWNHYNKEDLLRYRSFKVLLSGLKGGHSSGNIQDGGGNSVKLFFRFWRMLMKEFVSKEDLPLFSISALHGGDLANAIPSEFKAIVNVPKTHGKEELTKLIKLFLSEYFDDFKDFEDSFSMNIEEIKDQQDRPTRYLDSSFLEKMSKVVLIIPHGQIKKHHLYKSTETSNNLASIWVEENENEKNKEEGVLCFETKYRSNVSKNVYEMMETIEAIGEFTGALTIQTSDGYMGWMPVNPHNNDKKKNMSSKERKKDLVLMAQEVYEEIHHKKPNLVVSHGGLETGQVMNILGIKQGISFGPEIFDLHSTHERMKISSVAPFCSFLKSLIERISKI